MKSWERICTTISIIIETKERKVFDPRALIVQQCAEQFVET